MILLSFMTVFVGMIIGILICEITVESDRAFKFGILYATPQIF